MKILKNNFSKREREKNCCWETSVVNYVSKSQRHFWLKQLNRSANYRKNYRVINSIQELIFCVKAQRQTERVKTEVLYFCILFFSKFSFCLKMVKTATTKNFCKKIRCFYENHSYVNFNFFSVLV